MNTFISDIKSYIDAQLKKGTKPKLYTKITQVHARKGFPGEEIITRMKNGLQETKNIVKKGDWVITNPDGEQYIISKDSFVQKYEQDSQNSKQYRSKRVVQKFIPVNEDITFLAPWGEKMTIKKGGSLNISGYQSGDIYGIQEDEFKKTYVPCDENGEIIKHDKKTLMLIATKGKIK